MTRPPGAPLRPAEPSDDEDAQLSLWLTQQVVYRLLPGVDPGWEEVPSLLAVRHELERTMEAELRATVRVPEFAPGDLEAALADVIEAAADAPSLSAWVDEHGELDHLREFVVHRAPYQLQEADPHSFAIPRLESGTCKTALLELQLDEYGGHEPTEAHAALFADTMVAMGLEPVADVDRVPAVTLATNTLLNLLGRSRRLVGALLGHLAVFEMCSVEPMARYAATVRRVLPAGQATEAARFYDVHVAADAFHARLAGERLVAGFGADHPDEGQQVLFGAAALLHLEDRLTRYLLERWTAGASSLRQPLPGSRLHPPELLRAS